MDGIRETARHRKLDRGDPGAWFKMSDKEKESVTATREWGRPIGQEAPGRDQGLLPNHMRPVVRAADGVIGAGPNKWYGHYVQLRSYLPDLPRDVMKRAAKAHLRVDDQVWKWRKAGIADKHIAGPLWRLQYTTAGQFNKPGEAFNVGQHPHLREKGFKSSSVYGTRPDNDLQVDELRKSLHMHLYRHLEAAGVDADELPPMRLNELKGTESGPHNPSRYTSNALATRIKAHAAAGGGWTPAAVAKMGRDHASEVAKRAKSGAVGALEAHFEKQDSLPRLSGMPEGFREATKADVPKLADWCVRKNACLWRAVSGQLGAAYVPDRVAIHPGTGHVVGLHKQGDGTHVVKHDSQATDQNNDGAPEVRELFGRHVIK